MNSSNIHVILSFPIIEQACVHKVMVQPSKVVSCGGIPAPTVAVADTAHIGVPAAVLKVNDLVRDGGIHC